MFYLSLMTLTSFYMSNLIITVTFAVAVLLAFDPSALDHIAVLPVIGSHPVLVVAGIVPDENVAGVGREVAAGPFELASILSTFFAVMLFKARLLASVTR